jgi:F plasmid transfer operon protein TraF
MGGAFIAVADDATATHWNPAGLATGGPAGMTIGWYRFQSGNQDVAPYAGPARRSGTHTSVGSLPFGISYGRFEMTNLRDATGGRLAVETLRTRDYGGTLLQTVVEGIVVGTTLKYVRGSVVSALSEASTVGDALESTESIEGTTTGAFDLDLGVMVDMDQLRLGVVWKNLRSPTFGEVSKNAVTLPRQTRLGVAYLPSGGLTLAMDIDLDTVDLRGDLRRTFALGGEGRIGRRLAVRSGIRWSLTGERRLVGSAGMSLGIRSGFWLDGHYSQSHLDEDREFGVALRAGR